MAISCILVALCVLFVVYSWLLCISCISVYRTSHIDESTTLRRCGEPLRAAGAARCGEPLRTAGPRFQPASDGHQLLRQPLERPSWPPTPPATAAAVMATNSSASRWSGRHGHGDSPTPPAAGAAVPTRAARTRVPAAGAAVRTKSAKPLLLVASLSGCCAALAESRSSGRRRHSERQ